MAKQITGIITWLKGWFYDKTEITGFLNNKANVSDLQTTNGNITALQSRVSTLESFEFIKVTSTKPTPSASTMNTLYVVSETVNNKAEVNVYYTKATTNNGTTTYSLEKMDTDILDSLTINWSDIQGKPNSFTPSSHAHGAITSTGTIDNSSSTILDHSDVAIGDKIVIVDTSDGNKIKKGGASASQIIDIDSQYYGNLDNNPNSALSSRMNQSDINSRINDALGLLYAGKASGNHHHGDISVDGKITTALTSLSNDDIPLVAERQTGKIQRGEIGAIRICDIGGENYSNIFRQVSSQSIPQNPTQSALNSQINTELGSRALHSEVITSIELIPKSSNSTGAIQLYFGDESTTGHGTDWTDLT